MARPNEKLAAALVELKQLQDEGVSAIQSNLLGRATREVLLKSGYIEPVIKGWYLASRPEEPTGSSTVWYAHMREFIAGYCDSRFGNNWHVNPELSLMLLSGERSLPQQIFVWATQANNQLIALPHGTSLLLYRAPSLLPAADSKEEGGLRLVNRENALAAAGESFYRQQPLAAQLNLSRLAYVDDLARVLLTESQPVVAGRLAGALRAGSRPDLADELLKTMRSAGHDVRETNPFEHPLPSLGVFARGESPYVQRIRLLWANMRQHVIDHFPQPTPKALGLASILADIEARYVTDAYHSLSIEGYRVTTELIERVRNGNWNPDDTDKSERNAMAAKGYFDVHNLVKNDIRAVWSGANVGTVFRTRLSEWYRTLWGASVTAGLLKPADLAGYRNDQVYIANAAHVPVPKDAVRDCMPVLFELLETEPHAGVRAVLGHLVFVYIHPYMDGNGRLARFLMNLMLTTGGYIWTIVPVERRNDYMMALDQASAHKNILPFTQFIAALVEAQTRERLASPG
jgi:hypothetical protein